MRLRCMGDEVKSMRMVGALICLGVLVADCGGTQELLRPTRSDKLSIVHPRAYVESSARAKRPGELVQATLGAIKRQLQGKARTR